MQTTGYVRTRAAQQETTYVEKSVKAWRSYAKSRENRGGFRAVMIATLVVSGIMTKGVILAYLIPALLAACAWPHCRAPIRVAILLGGFATTVASLYNSFSG
ncbi:hypothetical protein HYV71_03535 [Candidatus Uhrbacteria bacterium]|nr:hypothetical protein [Candidatus Uhrbacteria bacterium]